MKKISFLLILLIEIIPVAYSQENLIFDVIDFNSITYTQLNENSDFEETQRNRIIGVGYYSRGYLPAPNEGRDNSTAAYCNNPTGNNAMGLMWSFTLSQTHPSPVRMTGWSRSEGVEGSSGSNYSLYIDVIYNDDTPSWGHNSPFQVGTDDWQKAELLVIPEKPIKRISCYALFRYKNGQAWFDDIAIEEAVQHSSMAQLDGLPVQLNQTSATPATTREYKTDQIKISLNPANGYVSSLTIQDNSVPLTKTGNGFLIRDVANSTGYYDCIDGKNTIVDCQLDLSVWDDDNAIHLKGKLTSIDNATRAVNLLYALPVNAIDGYWGDHIALSRSIQSPEEYHSWVEIGTGTNGQVSRYPFASVHNDDYGIAVGFDMGYPCQWRLGYSAGTQLLYVSMDFGLHPNTENFPSAAEFHLVVYSIDPNWGFRSAAERYYRIFPDYFEVRSKDQGIWMPFTDISTVQGWQDFGFKYKEGTNNIPFDDRSNILSFRYSEPSTWWMNMDTDIPRTYDEAMKQVNQLAESTSNSSLSKRAKSLLSSGSFDEDGRYQMQFRNEPWANGAVFSLNASPYLEAQYTNANLMWNETLAKQLYENNSRGTQDGEYLDSLEAYVTADLNFREEHFRYTTVPLTFTLNSRTPVIHKSFSQYEFTRFLSNEMHSRDKLLFANSVPYRFSFLCPWIDIMGTETNWISDRQFSPNSDSIMNYRRTLVGQKPYLFLMNTDFNYMTYAIVEKYFQYCLFYGMFPSMFSHNAAQDPYWQNPTLYNRDRPLFKQYQPLIKQVAQAGWQPVTYVNTNNESIRIERFGSLNDTTIYITVYNISNNTESTMLYGEESLSRNSKWIELLSNNEGEWKGGLQLNIEPKTVHVYKVELSNDDSSVNNSSEY
jgi:hypothetical protein